MLYQPLLPHLNDPSSLPSMAAWSLAALAAVASGVAAAAEDTEVAQAEGRTILAAADAGE